VRAFRHCPIRFELVLPFIGLPSISFESTKQRPGEKTAAVQECAVAKEQREKLDGFRAKLHPILHLMEDRPPREKHVHAYPNADANREIPRLELFD
jgi:hypothetical protein